MYHGNFYCLLKTIRFNIDYEIFKERWGEQFAQNSYKLAPVNNKFQLFIYLLRDEFLSINLGQYPRRYSYSQNICAFPHKSEKLQVKYNLIFNEMNFINNLPLVLPGRLRLDEMRN